MPSPSTTSATSLDKQGDQGLLSPMEDDDFYQEEFIPGVIYDRKGKGKERQRGYPYSTLKSIDVEPPGGIDVAKQAYLSPPLTASDSFLLGVQNISRVLRQGLSSIDFDVDLEDLHSDGSEKSSSSSSSSTPRQERSASPSIIEQDEEEVVQREEDEGGELEDPAPLLPSVVVRFVGSEISEDSSLEGHLAESSLLSSDPSDAAESSRKATVGDSTLQDAGSVRVAVRFPSIFTNDMDDVSSLESVDRTAATPSPLRPHVFSPRLLDDDDDDDDGVSRGYVSTTFEPRSPEERVEVKREQSGPVVVVESSNAQIVRGAADVRVRRGRRRLVRIRSYKIQEEGFSRDFLLIITLCFGLACAGILILRPTAMALYGL